MPSDPYPADLRSASPDAVAHAVRHELDLLEEAEGARVLLAVESGSRAWGFESPDSDFDVRLVYVRPIEYYLRLQSTRDVLEWRLDEVLDVSGWDLDKSLRLARGASPVVCAGARPHRRGGPGRRLLLAGRLRPPPERGRRADGRAGGEY